MDSVHYIGLCLFSWPGNQSVLLVAASGVSSLGYLGGMTDCNIVESTTPAESRNLENSWRSEEGRGDRHLYSPPRSGRLAVRTGDFQSPSRGSTPRRSTMIKITISKHRLAAGLPAYKVNDEWWEGFISRNQEMYVISNSGKSWISYYGDPRYLTPGGRIFEPKPAEELELVKWNLFVPGMTQRLQRDPSLSYVAVNRERVKKHQTAVTTYQMWNGLLCPSLSPQVRLDGLVYSCTVKPPRLGFPEPLNFWIETHNEVEVL